MGKITLLVGALVGITLLGCGPIKGYAGPEIASSRLVTISLANGSSGSLEEASVDGISFAVRAVQVLVGRHTMKTQFIRRSAPENCGMDREYDTCYSCREAREASCRRQNRDKPEVCSSLWQSEEMRVMCDYRNSSYECWLEATILHPGEYIIAARPGSDDVTLSGPNLELAFQCALVGTSARRERMR